MLSTHKLYNWDSYFISLGLLVDGQVSMAKGMVDHFVFEIKHYNKVSIVGYVFFVHNTELLFPRSWMEAAAITYVGHNRHS